MSSAITQEQRSAAASALAHKAELAQRLGSHSRSLELFEAAMRLEPTPERIHSWVLASAHTATGAKKEALMEVASWF